MNRIIFVSALLLFSLSLFSQQNKISGSVTDPSGFALPDVSIEVKDAARGTTTDLDGKFEIMLDISQNPILKFSYIGYLSQEIVIQDLAELKIIMEEDAVLLSDIIVIGYGTQKKKDVTTAVVSVNSEALENKPIVSAMEALQGKAAGVQIVKPSGKPGGDLTVRVRGSTSVLAGNEPLYVVDGVPTTDIRGLNPTDIESMTVLKDASSSSIYGARAANGVVVITTKRGDKNKTTLQLSSYYGISWLRKPIETLSTKNYRQLMEEIIPGSIDPKWTGYTNWTSETFGLGHNQSHQLSASGGSKASRFYTSFGFLSDEGIVDPAKYDRITLKVNLDNDLNNWLSLGTNLNVISSKTKNTPDNASSGRGGVIMSALNTPPFLQIYKDDESGWFDPNPFQPSWENPIAYMQGAQQEAGDNRLFGNVTATAKIMEGLSFKSNAGVDFTSHVWDYYLDPVRTNYGRSQNGIGRSNKFTYSSWLIENTLDYQKSLGNHNMAFLAGTSAQMASFNDSYTDGYDYPSDTKVTTLNVANEVNAWTNKEQWSLASFFGRASYNYKSTYYLTMSIRRDGSSKLAHHWGTMPSFSAGWRVSSEPFMQGLDWIDDLKLRGGWGKNGNQEGISNYARYGLISYYRRDLTNPLSGPASVQTSYGNPDLRWETTSQTNIGMDLSMSNYRVTLNVDAYIKKTNDVLLNIQLPNTLPITSIQTNAGKIENRGIEFNLNTVNVDRVLRWDTDFNLSFNKNKVLELDYTDIYYFGRIYSNNQDINIVREGLALGSFFGYISDGVDPETGDIIYRDVNENGIFDTGDRTIIGNGQPDFIFGLTNSLSYKKLKLNFFFQGSYGNEIFNATRIDLEGMFDSKNQSVAVLDRWTPQNTITDIPRPGSINNVRNSSRFVEDGSYIRLKSITLSYDFLTEKDKVKSFKKITAYVTGQNLLTFTNYSGFDPEVNAFGSSATEVGIDYGTYPQSVTCIFGLNIHF
jgi:TonB-linked SusC/RagA family outer membrane protein